MAQRIRGTVKMFNGDKGYGFITPESGADVWFSVRAIQRGSEPCLERGDAVEFEITDGKKGKEASRIETFLSPERQAALVAARQAAKAAEAARSREEAARRAAYLAEQRVRRCVNALAVACTLQALQNEVGGEFSPEWALAWLDFNGGSMSVNTVDAGWYTWVDLSQVSSDIRAAAARGERYAIALHPEDGEWSSMPAYWTPDPRPTSGLTPSDYDYDADADSAAWVNPSECSEMHSTPESRALQCIRDAMARARNATTLAETDAALCAALDAVYAANGIVPQGVASGILKARKSLRDAARHDTRMTVGELAEVMARMDAILAHRARQAARETSEPTASASGAAIIAAQPQEKRMTEFVNLTPHALNIQREDGTMLEIAPSGTLTRCAEVREPRPSIDGIVVSVATFGDVTGLPEPHEGVVYIVSGLVLAAVPNRADVFAPGPALRDSEGKIVGSVGLSATPVYK